MDSLVFPPGFGYYEEAALRICVQVFEWIYVSIEYGHVSRSGHVGFMVSAYFTLNKQPNTSSANF